MSNRLQQSQWDFEGKSNQPTKRTIYRVSELNRKVKALLQNQFGGVWVEGEVTGLRQQSSGHVYFAIKDDKGQLNCALFRGITVSQRSLIKNGVQVLLLGELTLFEARGQYQLIVRKLEFQGQGALQIQYEQLKRKLEAEGLFAPEKKRHLPTFPSTMGLVTSPAGAAIRDVLHVIQRRNPSLQIVLEPSRVQGSGAEDELIKAIQRLNHWSERQTKPMDLILLTRGGGSIEDLWAFNEEMLARAISNSRVPVVSAVGHEIDFLISDFAADVRAATPSVAAELITNNAYMSREFLGAAPRQLTNLAKRSIGWAKRDYDSICHRLNRLHPRRSLDDLLQHLDQLLEGLNRLLKQGIKSHSNHCRLVTQKLDSLHPGTFLARRREQLEWTERRLAELVQHKNKTYISKLKQAKGRLELLSPMAILGRGYSITCDAASGQILRDANKVKSGQKLRTQLHHGEINSRVSKPNNSC